MTALQLAGWPSGTVNDRVRRIIARLLPWWDDSDRRRRSEEVLRRADLTLARVDQLRGDYRAADRRIGRMSGR